MLGLLAACDEDGPPPPPHELTGDDISHYDQMIVLDHQGPKAQILLESRDEPVWFSSVRDAFAFHHLPEEPRDIAAIYVTDMARAATWADPGPGIWIEARDAWFVIGSAMRGGMGAEEPVPFGTEEAAEGFAAEHGGDVVGFDDVPENYVLGATAEPPQMQPEMPRADGGNHEMPGMPNTRGMRSVRMEDRMDRRRFIGIVAATGAMAALPARAGEDGFHVWNGTALGGRASLRLHHPAQAEAEAVIRRCVAEIGRLERIFSLYRPDSALGKLNRHAELPAPPFDLVRLLDEARRFNRLTDGVFDVTVQPLWNLYATHFARQPVPAGGPAADAIADALARVGQDKLEIGLDRIAFARPGMGVTANGIAQGYITDRIAGLLHEEGFTNVLLDLGEVRGLGEHATGTPWRAALADPAGGPALRTVELRDRALATSAPSGFAFDPGQRFNHIFDPRTGRTAEAHASVSVLASDATTADALSTAFVQMPVEDIRQVLGSQSGVTVHVLARDRGREELSSPEA